MKTTLIKEADIKHDWVMFDAADKVLGRLAVKIANRLRGRYNPLYCPHTDIGDFVIVINASKVKLTGKKEDLKEYQSYSGYRGGRRVWKASDIRERHPDRLIYDAVRRMLPKNRSMRQVLRRLKICPGNEHPHAAQQPQTID